MGPRLYPRPRGAVRMNRARQGPRRLDPRVVLSPCTYALVLTTAIPSLWQSPHDETGRPMVWDSHNGKWVPTDSRESGGESGSPKRRTVSPARPSASASSSHSSLLRRGSKGHLEESMSGADPELPGWVVLQRTTNTGRSYKV